MRNTPILSGQDDTCRRLLQCLRSLVEGTAADIPASGVTPELLEAATRQGVVALVWDALPDATKAQVDWELRVRWAYSVANMERIYRIQLTAARKLSAFFEQHGIRTVVFKGLPVSSCYPVPEHRPCGDIDCWLCGRFADGNRLIAESGIAVKYENPKHSIFNFDRVPVENHLTFLDTTTFRIDLPLNDFMEREIARAGVTFDAATGLWTLSPTVHALFLLRHAGMHFSEGIALRHICDWAFFVRTHAREIDWELLLPLIRDTRQTTLLGVFNSICVDYFGMDKSLFPLFEPDSRLRDRVLEDILSFGTHHQITSRNPVRIFAAKTGAFFRRRWKTRDVKHESFSLVIVRSVLSHLRAPSTMFKTGGK